MDVGASHGKRCQIATKIVAKEHGFWYTIRKLTSCIMSTSSASAVVVAGLSASSPAQADQVRDCTTLRLANGWSRAEFRQCKLEETHKRTAKLDADFATMKTWLQARGLDVNDAGHITDPKGRTLAQIETSNAALAAGNAELAAGNAALRAQNHQLNLEIKTLDEEYQRILREFSRTVLKSAQ